MAETAAAIGIEQLKKLDDMNYTRIKISNEYKKYLKKYERWIQIQSTANEGIHTYHGFPLAVKKEAPFSREDIVNFLENQGIETRAFLGGCLPDQPAFRDKKHRIVGNLEVSRYLTKYSFFIGCHPGLSKSAVDYVIESLQSFLEEYTTKEELGYIKELEK